MRRSKEETRRRLLEAGAELLLANGLPEAINIKMADACERLGVTSGAAYQIWRSQEHFQTELTHHVIDTFDWLPSGIVAELDQAATSGKSADDAFYSAAKAHFETLVDRREFQLMLHLWSVTGLTDDQAVKMRSGFQRIHHDLITVLAGSLPGFGLELRPDTEVADLAVAIVAVGDGLALRHRFDPDSGNQGHAYAETVVALIRHVTRPIDDR